MGDYFEEFSKISTWYNWKDKVTLSWNEFLLHHRKRIKN